MKFGTEGFFQLESRGDSTNFEWYLLCVVSAYLLAIYGKSTISSSTLVTLHVAVEAASVDIGEKMPVHLPEVLVGDDVDEDVDRVHPPVPGVAHQVPEHINLCQVKLSIVDVKTKKFFQIKNRFC